MNFTLIPRVCRGCGCSDLHACPGGCYWVLFDIETPSGVCSECARDMEWDPLVMAVTLAGIEARARFIGED